MRIADWNDYELIDTSAGERLERWGDIILIRPDPQIIWNTPKTNPLWRKAHARYHRSNTGGGHWQEHQNMPAVWSIRYKEMTFNLKPMGFKHTGIFPEQAVNWDFAMNKIKEAKRPIKVLNLFGYTGAASLACASAGAEVCHVDASKGMVAWAKENAVSSGLADKPIRWLVDDCVKFVQREQRRGNTYDVEIGILFQDSMRLPAIRTTVLLWTRRLTEEDRAAKCGSWKNSFTIWWSYVCRFYPNNLYFLY